MQLCEFQTRKPNSKTGFDSFQTRKTGFGEGAGIGHPSVLTWMESPSRRSTFGDHPGGCKSALGIPLLQLHVTNVSRQTIIHQRGGYSVVQWRCANIDIFIFLIFKFLYRPQSRGRVDHEQGGEMEWWVITETDIKDRGQRRTQKTKMDVVIGLSKDQ
jgi:hypothetical protein